jgi:hypothetical protein
MYLNDYLYICIYTYLDRQSCRFFFATFEFHITLFLFPWSNIYYDHCHLDILLSHSGYPRTNHHHRPATAAIFSVVQWHSGAVAGCLAGCLAGLLACWLACLLAGSLPCLLAGSLPCLLAGLLPGHTSLRELSQEKKSPGGGKKNPSKNSVPEHLVRLYSASFFEFSFWVGYFDHYST